MNDYFHVRFTLRPCTETECDVLAALLCDVGFESFLPDEKGVSAYIKKEAYNAAAVEEALCSYPFSATIDFSAELIEGQDWNKEWERNYFQPIVFENKCVVHSSFHHDYPRARYDIVIDPKMAFGTGHHETTNMMISRILSAKMEGKSVLDMGTGTGILAILSAMCGAAKVVGVEIDPVAYENAVENVRLNNVGGVALRLGGAETESETAGFDFVVAYINRNSILGDLPSYAKALKPGGTMLLSGFYVDDVPMIEAAAQPCGLALQSVIEQKRWANVRLLKE